MQMRNVLVGVDIGSTNLKVVGFFPDGTLAGSEERPMLDCRHSYGAAQYVYADPAYVFGAVLDMLKALRERLDGQADILSIAVTGMGDDGLPLGADNEPLYPIISWKCRRTLPYFERFREEYGFDNYFCITGLQARNMDTIFKLLWLRENEPTVHAKTEKWLFIEDYVNYRLCGAMATDPSVATTSGLLDLARQRWSDELTGYVGMRSAQFPAFVRGGSRIGGLNAPSAAYTGISEGTPVVMGGWDIQCAAVALGALRANSVVDTMGTWETINIVADKPVLTKAFYEYGFHVCNHVAEGLYSYPVFLLSSRVVEWYLNAWYNHLSDKKERYAALMADAEAAGCGAGGVVFLPQISGSYFPHIDPDYRGAFAGISEQSGRPAFSRALLEGLTFMTSQVVYTCEELLGSSLEDILVTGGGVRNRVWMQIKASILDRTLHLSGQPEDTALGAAMLAGVGCGAFSDLAAAQRAMRGGMQIQQPVQADAARYREQLARYERIYTALGKADRAR